jgi:hypothetical protein
MGEIVLGAVDIIPSVHSLLQVGFSQLACAGKPC